MGTSQVSAATNAVTAHWMSAIFQSNFFCIGVTNSVQPYCRLAIITMQITPKASCHQRPAFNRARAASTDDAAGSFVVDETDPSFVVMGVLLAESVFAPARYVVVFQPDHRRHFAVACHHHRD